MGHYFSGLNLTLLLFSVWFAMGTAQAGTVGTPESEIQRLEGEVAQAQNALDTELLKLETKPSDPKVKAKAKILEEKTNELREEFRKRTQRTKAASNGAPVASSYTTSAPKEPAPGPTLSGEGLKDEIIYKKKSKTRAPVATETTESKETPDPAASPTEGGSGITEIQYPKKSNTKKKPTP